MRKRTKKQIVEAIVEKGLQLEMDELEESTLDTMIEFYGSVQDYDAHFDTLLCDAADYGGKEVYGAIPDGGAQHPEFCFADDSGMPIHLTVVDKAAVLAFIADLLSSWKDDRVVSVDDEGCLAWVKVRPSTKADLEKIEALFDREIEERAEADDVWTACQDDEEHSLAEKLDAALAGADRAEVVKALENKLASLGSC